MTETKSDNIVGIYVPANYKEPIEAIEFPKEVSARVDKMQALIGGYFAIFPFNTTDINVYCNDEGMILDLPINERVAAMLELLKGYYPAVAYPLFGDCLIFGKADEDGNNTSAPKDLLGPVSILTKLQEVI